MLLWFGYAVADLLQGLLPLIGHCLTAVALGVVGRLHLIINLQLLLQQLRLHPLLRGYSVLIKRTIVTIFLFRTLRLLP